MVLAALWAWRKKDQVLPLPVDLLYQPQIEANFETVIPSPWDPRGCAPELHQKNRAANRGVSTCSWRQLGVVGPVVALAHYLQLN